MIIEKNALYQALQDGFSNFHPKFPWPKRHDLIDQTEDFQKAFSHFVDYVNETARTEIIEHRKIEVDHYKVIIKEKDAEIKHARNAVILPWFIIGVSIGAFVIGLIVGYTG